MAKKGTKQQSRPLLVELFHFLFSWQFLRTILFIFIFLCIVFFGVLYWLRIYTKHDQHIEMPDYTGLNYANALEDAGEKSFRLSITDSIHIVGKPGHEILSQNPRPGSLVKENRTIYVTITKRKPDQIPLNRLPQLYGRNYHRKKRELQNSFEISSRIVGKQFDPGEPDHILAVIYQGDTIIDRKRRVSTVSIEKGGTLEFILSEQSGAYIPIPELTCMTYGEAMFLLESLGLGFGEILIEGSLNSRDNAYISSQTPASSEGEVLMGSTISISLTEEKPVFCD